MNEHRGFWTRVAARPFGGTVSLLLLGAVACWLIAANLGCGGEWWDFLRTFNIRFTPESVLVNTPGEAGTVRTQLWWTEGPSSRLITAREWSVEGGVPPIFSSVNLHPRSNHDTTTVSWVATGDASLFAGDDLFVSTADKSHQLGVKAFFPDPTWKGLTGGEELMVNRTAYLPVLAAAPRISLELVMRSQSYGWDNWQFQMSAPEIPNFSFSYRLRYAADYSDTGLWGIHEKLWKPVHQRTLDFATAELGYERAWVWFDLETRYRGQVVREERRRFEFVSGAGGTR